MKYTPATIAKAITGGAVAALGAATAAAGGADLSVLDAGQWIGVLGAGLVAFGAVFATPNKDHNPAPDQSPADAVITGMQQATQNKAAADSELDKIKDAAGSILGTVPVVGPLTQAAIDNFKIPRL